MSDLNPKGIEIEIGGEKRRLLFTYNVIAEIQDDYETGLFQAVNQIIPPENSGALPGEYQAGPLTDIVHKLLCDETERERFLNGNTGLRSYTKQQVGWMITLSNSSQIVKALFDSIRESMPKIEKDEAEEKSPNVKRGSRKKSTSPEQS